MESELLCNSALTADPASEKELPPRVGGERGREREEREQRPQDYPLG